MAAILRASVKRAIAGCMPFGQQAFIELTEGAVDGAGRRRRTLEQVFQIVIVVAVESRINTGFLARTSCPSWKR